MDFYIAGLFITYQCVKLDYPFEAAIRSALDLCDYVLINDGGSIDGTLDILNNLKFEYGSDRVKIYEKQWVHDRGFWSRERNFLINQVPSDHYVLNLAADECLHESEVNIIKKIIPLLNGKALRFIPIHFYGLPKYVISGRNWAKVLTKLWRRDCNIYYYNIPGGCADDPLWPNKQPAHFINCYVANIHVYHYGHCRDPRALAMKNEKAHSLYRGETIYSDGSFPEIKFFDYKIDKYLRGYNGDKLIEFDGTHPKYIIEWCNKHANQKLSYGSENG